MWIRGWNATQNGNFYQVEAASAAGLYSLDAGFKLERNFKSNGSTVGTALVWLDDTATEISRFTRDVTSFVGDSDWNHFDTPTVTAPARTVRAHVLFPYTPDETIENASQAFAFVDDVSLVAVPESSFAALLVLGGLALLLHPRK